MDIGYDPTLLMPTSVTFGDLLGDPLLFQALTASNLAFAPNIVEAAEVSLLSNAQLDLLQAASFTLFTVDFQAIGNGTTSVQYAGGPIDDGNGNLLFGTKTIGPMIAPEPGSLVLLGSGLCFLAVLGRLRLAAKGRRAE